VLKTELFELALNFEAGLARDAAAASRKRLAGSNRTL
jgi:hypothetical protein